MVQWRQFVVFSQLGSLLRVRKNLINIQVHHFETYLFVFARRISKMADENGPLTFNSRSKSPNDRFSNFYEAKIEMPKGVFGSVEHYFQAMKFIDKNHSRFAVNGDLGKRRIDSGSWKEGVSRGRFIKSVGGKAGTQKYKLTLRRNGLDREWAKQKMKEGLLKKFEVEPFRDLLLNTGTRELVHMPMRGKTDFWTGKVDKTNGNITGENNMGKLLMEVRQKLVEAEEESLGAADDKTENVDENTGDAVMTEDDDTKAGDESGKVDEKSSDDDKNVGVENKGDDESTANLAEDSSDNKGEKRRHDDKDEGPEIKRKKVEEESQEDLENEASDNESDGDNKDDDEETPQEAKE